MPKTNSNESNPVKKVMNEEERSALAATLDEDLETFMESLASKKVTSHTSLYSTKSTFVNKRSGEEAVHAVLYPCTLI